MKSVQDALYRVPSEDLVDPLFTVHKLKFNLHKVT